MPVSDATYSALVLEDRESKWELVCGRLRRKPDMTARHNELPRALLAVLLPQLPRRDYSISDGTARLRISTGTYYVPDLCVIPRAMVHEAEANRPTEAEIYEEPVPLVVEVWSPSTGEYDVDTKLREYQLRKDREIWRIHPIERTLTRWVLRGDGSYREDVIRHGIVELVAIPGVTIELSLLWL